MKVCTDSCLFGAIVAHHFYGKANVLDIGAGTGLLSLMYAQKSISTIDAVEIDDDAFLQLNQNVTQSKYCNQINVYHKNIFTYTTDKKYDLIICNPPFFKNQLEGNNEKKNVAKHNQTFGFAQLILKAKAFLDSNGSFTVLLPFYEKDNFIELALQSNFYLTNIYKVKQTVNHTCFRVIMFFEKNEKEVITQEISIKDSSNFYSKEFLFYLKDYYLNL